MAGPESFLKWVKVLSNMIPSWTISTKVKANACRLESDIQPIKVETKPPLWHSKVSLGWGCELIEFEKLVKESIQQIPPEISIFLTQGSEDSVCPPEYARALHEDLPSVNKTYLELDGMLHEPFKGEGSEQLFGDMERWLDGLEFN